MLQKLVFGLAALCIAMSPAVSVAQEGKQAQPSVILRIQSFDRLIQSMKVIAKAVDKEEFGNQLERLIERQAGANGLDGVDTKRPIGFYARAAEDLGNLSAVLMIPVSNEKAFLDLLKNLNVHAKKDESGLYTLDFDLPTPPPVPVGMRFVNKYAYVTGLNLDAISDANVLSPEQVFANTGDNVIFASLRIDHIPKAFRDLAISKMEEEIAKEKEKERPGESPEERKLRHKGIDAAAEQMADFINGAKELRASINIDPQTQKLTADMSLSTRKTSRLAAAIGKLGESPSLFAEMVNQKAAGRSLVHVKFPDSIKAAIDEIIATATQKAIQEQNNPQQRQQVEALFKALDPALKSGELDMATVLRTHPDDKQISAAFAIRVKNARDVEGVLKNIIQDLPPGERAKFKLDDQKVDNLTLHRIDVQNTYDAKARALLGDSPVWIAFGSEAMYVAVGKDATKIIAASAKAEAGKTPAVLLDADIAQLATILGEDERQREAVQKAFAGGKQGLIRVTVEGGDELRAQISMDLSILRLAAMSNVTEIRIE